MLDMNLEKVVCEEKKLRNSFPGETNVTIKLM